MHFFVAPQQEMETTARPKFRILDSRSVSPETPVTPSDLSEPKSLKSSYPVSAEYRPILLESLRKVRLKRTIVAIDNGSSEFYMHFSPINRTWQAAVSGPAGGTTSPREESRMSSTRTLRTKEASVQGVTHEFGI